MKEERVQLSEQPLQGSNLDCCSIWQRILLHVRSHRTYEEPCFPGLPQPQETQHLHTAHFRSLTNCCEVAMGGQVSPWWTTQYEHSRWRSLRFLGSVSFVYFSCSMFLFCPLGYSARSFPISHLTFEPHTSSKFSGLRREDAPLVQAQEVAPHSFCPLLSQKCMAHSLKDLYLEGTHIRPFTFENPDQSRAGGVGLLQTDSV